MSSGKWSSVLWSTCTGKTRKICSNKISRDVGFGQGSFGVWCSLGQKPFHRLSSPLYYNQNVYNEDVGTRKGGNISREKVRGPSGYSDRIGKQKPLTIDKKKKAVKIQSGMSPVDLAAALNVGVDDVMEKILQKGLVPPSENAVIKNIKLLETLCRDFRKSFVHKTKTEIAVEEKMKAGYEKQPPPDPKTMELRPPVITIMGHIDHGKTTLLDALRNSNVTAQEFGGITQHIGAFTVDLPSGKSITYLDTPGHAAFMAMRARGASVTDIIVLVVSAEDGVMPQTIECIEHAKKYDVPIVVAVNKIDSNQADVERIYNNLLEHEIQVESLGGSVPAVPISALKRTNLTELQETISVLAEILDLRCDKKGLVEGHIIEAKLHPRKGKVATVLVERGVLKKGSILLAGKCWAKVKSLHDDRERVLKSVSPSYCAEITGWRDLPTAGDEVIEMKSEKKATELIRAMEVKDQLKRQEEESGILEEKREQNMEIYKMMRDFRTRSHYRDYLNYRDTLLSEVKDSLTQENGPLLSVVLKVDVYGSLEALLGMFEKFDSQVCKLEVIRQEVGDITESDIEVAQSVDGEVFGFNVNMTTEAKLKAEEQNVPVKISNVIYSLVDELVKSANSLIPLQQEEDVLGHANVLKTFRIKTKKSSTAVAGCMCVKGNMNRGLHVKVMRADEEVFRGKIETLKFEKDDVESVESNQECGITVNDNSFEFKEGDELICFEAKQVKLTVDWATET